MKNEKDEKDERIRIKTPGFTIGRMVIAEQAGGGIYAVHEKLGDNTW